MYTVRCVFCKREHTSEFFDEIEEEILACRAAAPYWMRGDLESFEDPKMPPISCEVAARGASLDNVDYGV